MNEQDERYGGDEFTPDFAGAERLVSAGRVAPPGPEVIGSALTAVRAAAAAETVRAVAADTGAVTADRPLRGSVPRPGLSRRRMLLAAGGAAAAAAGVAFLPKDGPGAGPGGGSGARPPATARTAPTFLRQVAFVAAGGSATAAPYWRVESASEFHMPEVRRRPDVTPKPGVATVAPGEVIRSHRVAWLSRDGLTERSDSGEVSWLPSGGPMSWSVAGKDITWDDLPGLPTTPAALKDRLVGGDPRPAVWAALFNGIDALLSRAPSSPDLRAALYEVLAGIPGIRLRGPAKDAVGRTGTAVELDGDDRRGRLVIAPKTALLLETGVYALGGKEDGRLVSRSTFLSVGPARTAPRADASEGVD